MRAPTTNSFNTHSTPGNGQVTDYQKVKLPMPREFNGKKYYGAADVAKIIGVSKKTVWQWQNDLYFDCPLFTADERAHDGRYLYEVERVMQLKAVYHPNWTRGGYEPAPFDEKQSRIDEAERSFNLLFGEVKNRKFGYIWTKQGEVRKTFPFDVSNPDERRQMAQKAIELNDAGADVYYGINLMDVPAAANARVTAEHVTLQTATVTDIDIEGGNHISNETKKYPPNFDTAKSFLPFPVSILVNSGYGLHGLCIYDVPIIITADNRAACEERNKKFLDVIRSRAGNYAKAVDGVGDLPRVFRVPGTRNYKLGVSNDAPICHIVEVNDLRFTPTEIDDKLNALIQTQQENVTESKIDYTSNSHHKHFSTSLLFFDDDKDFNIFRARRMLDFISPSSLTYNEWLAVGMALKNIGCDCSDWEQWSRFDERFKDGECKSKWNGFNRDGYNFGTLYHFAAPNGYDAKEIYREWYDLHPNLKPSAKRNMADETKRELDDAIIWIDTLDPEKFTANDARDFKHIHSVALAMTYGFVDAAEKFFSIIKKAKELARIRLKDAESGLTEKLSETESNEINALIEGVHIETIRRFVDREVTALSKAHSDFLKTETRRKKREEAKKKQAEEIAQYKSNEEQLKELLAMPPSIERDVKVVQIINELCEWRHDRQGNPVSVKGTQANMDLIFNDPALNGLIGYDEFQQADVLLKAPPWRPHAKKGDEWSDRDDAQFRAYLRRTYKEFSAEKIIFDTVTSYSDANSFHEVKDYFNNLPKWDGIPRAETFFIDWLNVADSKFVREVTLKWLTAAIARIFHPGCEFQWALVLHGNQKIGKGYVLKRIGGKWYKAISDRVDDPHAADTVKLVWIGEFKEMNGMRKADVNAIKDFIELPADTRRFAYARRAKTVLRHCVFAITVNDDSFLSDLTGNRRFLILHSNLPKFGYVRSVRGEKLSDDNVIAQIWAEVYEHYKELFKNGFDERKLELSSEAEHTGEEIANTYLNDNGLTGEIEAFLKTKILPPVIWQLMTSDERRKFNAESKFEIEKRDLIARFRNNAKKISAKRQAEFDAAITESDSVLHVDIRNRFIGESVAGLKFFGTEYRQHVCAAEIFNEAFAPNDKRKSMARIHEILAQMDGWHLGKRIQKYPVYGDQKKVYYRNDDNQLDEKQTENDDTVQQTNYTDDLPF